MKGVATLRTLLVLGLLLALQSCSLFGPKLAVPRLKVVSIGMLSADLFSQQFLVRMNVQNPNDRELPIKGIDYKLFLQGDSFAEGVTNAPFVIPALGESQFDMTVRTNFVSSIGRLVSRLNGKNKVEYVIEGTVFTRLGFFSKIPFQEAGEVDLNLKK
jgi:LEA14-like dessication related protein